MSWSRRRGLASVACLAASYACSTERGAGPITPRPSVSRVAAVVNPYNSLSSVVTFAATNADSARIVYWIEGDSPQMTPYYLLADTSAKIVVLGLRPDITYSYTVEVVGENVTARSAAAQFTTGALPQFLGGVHLTITAGTPSPGYILTAVSPDDTVGYAVAFDESGNVAWYRRFSDGVPASGTQQTANGNFTVFLGATLGGQPTYGRYVEFRPSGEVVRYHVASSPYYTDDHELLVTSSDTAHATTHLFGYAFRQTDMTALGGAANALIAGHVLLRQAANGQVEFMWNAWDHFQLQDWIEPPDFIKQQNPTDFDHPNSLDIDNDGNYIVSWRHLGEITKIDSRNGNIIWRLGGRNNQFTIVDPLSGFSGQHSAGVLDNGNLLVYDNGWRHSPPETRAVEYSLDPGTKTATLVWEYRHNPPIFTGFVGSVQRFRNGNTLIGWGFVGTVTEVTMGGAVAWEGNLIVNGVQTIFYRALKAPSLYHYESP